MTEGAKTVPDALLDDLCENPADPLPALALADWCEENGRPGEAAGWRWVAVNGKYPGHEKVGNLEEFPYWWDTTGSNYPEHSRLPTLILQNIKADWKNLNFGDTPSPKAFSSVRKAFTEVVRVVTMLHAEGKWNP